MPVSRSTCQAASTDCLKSQDTPDLVRVSGNISGRNVSWASGPRLHEIQNLVLPLPHKTSLKTFFSHKFCCFPFRKISSTKGIFHIWNELTFLLILNLLAPAGCDTRSVFKRDLKVSEFYSPRPIKSFILLDLSRLKSQDCPTIYP